MVEVADLDYGERWFGSERDASGTHWPGFTVGPLLAFYNDTVHIGNIAPKLRYDGMGVHNIMMDVGNGRMGIHDQLGLKEINER